MNRKETLLAAQTLESYADALSNNGCNDWEWPKDWNEDERREFVRQYRAWNGTPLDFDPDFPLLDFAVARFLASKLAAQVQDLE